MHFPGLSAAQALDYPAKPQSPVGCVLCPSQVQDAQVTRYLARTQVGCVSYAPPQSWLLCFLDASQGHSPSSVGLLWGAYQAVTLLVDVNCPGSQEDVVSNWQPAHRLVENAVSGAKITATPRILADCCLSASREGGS